MIGGRPEVVVHTTDPELTRDLAAALPGVDVVQATAGEDLSRLLGAGGVALLVAHLHAGSEVAWRRLAVIRDALPTLPILAYLDGADDWPDEHVPAPATRVLHGPVDAAALAQAAHATTDLPLDTVDAVRAAPLAPGTAPAWAVLGLAGGSGATTLALLLAGRLAQTGPVILADLDRRHSGLTSALRVTPRYTVDDLEAALDDADRLDDALRACLAPVADGVRLLAGVEDANVFRVRGAAAAILQSCRRLGETVVADVGDLPRSEYPTVSPATQIVATVPHDISCVRRVPAAASHLAAVAPAATVHLVLARALRGTPTTPGHLADLIGVRWATSVPEHGALHQAANDVDQNPMLLAATAPRAIDDALTTLTGQRSAHARHGLTAWLGSGRRPAPPARPSPDEPLRPAGGSGIWSAASHEGGNR